jgi:adenylate cyclase
VDYLRMLASGQIVSHGWRVGISIEEGRGYFHEAKGIAEAAGNVRANALLHAGFGRLLAVRGSADDYCSKVYEAIDLAKSCEDASLEVMLKAGLCHALRLAGRLKPALALNIEASTRAHEINKLHREILGFEIEPWLTTLRGQLLVMLGRFNEARPYLDRVLQMDPMQINASDHAMPSVSYVDLARAKGDASLAELHSQRAIALAVSSGSPYLNTYGRACRGLARLLAGDCIGAVRELKAARDYALQHSSGLEYEPRIVADLADAYRLAGQHDVALQTADESIKISMVRHTRVAECLARIVRAQTLSLTQGEGLENEIANAEKLLDETGAMIYAPILKALKSGRKRLQKRNEAVY